MQGANINDSDSQHSHKQSDGRRAMPSDATSEEHHKTPVGSISEIEVGDVVDVFCSGGPVSATVDKVDLPGVGLTIELRSGATKLRLKEYSGESHMEYTGESVQKLHEWKVGIEEDFADWRPIGTVHNIELVETNQSEASAEHGGK